MGGVKGGGEGRGRLNQFFLDMCKARFSDLPRKHLETVSSVWTYSPFQSVSFSVLTRAKPMLRKHQCYASLYIECLWSRPIFRLDPAQEYGLFAFKSPLRAE